MKIGFFLTASMFFLLFCGDVAAQFSQPPPNRAAPTCDLRKRFPAGEPIQECKRNPVLASSPSLTCGNSNNDQMYCTTRAWVLVGGQWIEIDHSSAIHDWAFIIDGQQHYMAPVKRGDIWFGCGNSRQGYVRVAVAGGWTQQAFRCPTPTQIEW